MSDERLDQLIDDVARQMTRGQLSSDFRARVIGGLDRHRRRTWSTWWIAVPLGAMAVTMIALAVARPFKGRDRGAESGAPRQSSQAMKTETAPAAPTSDATTVRLPPSPPGPFGETGKPDTAFERPRQGAHVAAGASRQNPSGGAAAEVAALAPAPLEVQPLGVEAIGIDALPTGSIPVPQLDAIAPIGIAPLPSDEERSSGANEATIGGARTSDYRLSTRLPTIDSTTDYRLDYRLPTDY